MFKGKVDNLPCKADVEVTMVLPNVLEIWSMTIKTEKEAHQFKGITILGLRLAYKSAIKPCKGEVK